MAILSRSTPRYIRSYRSALAKKASLERLFTFCTELAEEVINTLGGGRFLMFVSRDQENRTPSALADAAACQIMESVRNRHDN
jgi:hypothetical protein